MFGNKKNHRRHAVVYMDRSGDTAIIVPLHYNGAGGFLFEDVEPIVIRTPNDPESLGTTIKRALMASAIRPESADRIGKLTDWPAFKSSRKKSVRQFESAFIRIDVSGMNEANLFYNIEGWPDKNAEVRVLASASAFRPEELGERCMRVWRACRDKVL